MIKEWLLLIVLLILLHAGLFLGWVGVMTAPRPTMTPIIWLMVGYLVLFVVILFIFTKRLNRAASPRDYRQARANGIAATAKILYIKRTRWRIRRNLSFSLQTRPARHEYEMRVRVKPPDAPEYEARLAEFITGAEAPSVGDTLSVKIHPSRPDVVVIAPK